MLNTVAYPTMRKPHLLMLILLISFGVVCSVLFVPALPSIATFFQISNQSAQMTVTLYLLGYALGQLPYGPLSNRFGRIKTLNIGIACQIIGAILCVLSYSIESFYLLLFGRFVTALGASVGLMMSFTLLNDFYSQTEARLLSSKMMMAFAILPGLSLAIGGFLCSYFSWHSCFYFLVFYGFSLLALVHFFLEEPNISRVQSLSIQNITQDFIKILKNKEVILYALLMGGCTAILNIYNTISPFIAIEGLGLSESRFGMLGIVPLLGILLGSLLSNKLDKHFSVRKVIFIGIIIAFTLALTMWFSFNYHMNEITLFLPMMFVNCGLTLVLSNASVLSSSAATDKANASSIMSFVNLSIATFTMAFVQLMPQGWGTLLPSSMLIVLVVMALILHNTKK